MLNNKAHILVVDDEPLTREDIAEFLKEEGCQVTEAGSGEQASQIIQENPYEVIVTDLQLGDIDGIELLRRAKKINPATIVILITGYASIESAVEAMQEGAYHYLIKPLKLEELSLVIKRALEQKRITEENLYLRQELRERYSFGNLIGKSRKMQAVYELVERVSGSNCNVLIYGESGSGKELTARAIHYNSPRRERRFLALDCASLPETLLESELFGHSQGAYTGATQAKEGLLQAANGGTIFLDEIGDVSPNLQTKLLRVIQEREVRRVGETKVKPIDVRIISATHQDLEKAIREKRFREDLFYRLNVVCLHLPPLRERKEDIPLLAYHFLDRYGQGKKKEKKEISKEAMSVLLNHSWPGNVRELENVIERAIVLGKGKVVLPEDLPVHLRVERSKSRQDTPEHKSLEEIEKEHIVRVLRETEGHQGRAAKILGITRKTLYSKMRNYGLVNQGILKG